MATVKNKYITEPASEIVEAWLIVTAQANCLPLDSMATPLEAASQSKSVNEFLKRGLNIIELNKCREQAQSKSNCRLA
jgi:hypothetical protein